MKFSYEPGAVKANVDVFPLPTDANERKDAPLCTGVIDYFLNALFEVAKVSKTGNDQHNPGQPLHWEKGKSTDHADCIIRHLGERGTFDTDGRRHSAKLAWRALALLQEELETENKRKLVEGAQTTWPKQGTKEYQDMMIAQRAFMQDMD